MGPAKKKLLFFSEKNAFETAPKTAFSWGMRSTPWQHKCKGDVCKKNEAASEVFAPVKGRGWRERLEGEVGGRGWREPQVSVHRSTGPQVQVQVQAQVQVLPLLQLQFQPQPELQLQLQFQLQPQLQVQLQFQLQPQLQGQPQSQPPNSPRHPQPPNAAKYSTRSLRIILSTRSFQSLLSTRDIRTEMVFKAWFSINPVFEHTRATRGALTIASHHYKLTLEVVPSSRPAHPKNPPHQKTVIKTALLP